MTRRQLARERRAYNRWRRWATVSGGYSREEACTWAEWAAFLRGMIGRVPRDFARVAGSRLMRAESARIKRAKAADWARRHL